MIGWGRRRHEKERGRVEKTIEGKLTALPYACVMTQWLVMHSCALAHFKLARLHTCDTRSRKWRVLLIAAIDVRASSRCICLWC